MCDENGANCEKMCDFNENDAAQVIKKATDQHYALVFVAQSSPSWSSTWNPRLMVRRSTRQPNKKPHLTLTAPMFRRRLLRCRHAARPLRRVAA